MTVHERPGPLRRTLAALGAALGRGLLGKASDAYMRQFNGGDDHGAPAPAALTVRPPRAPRAAPPPEYEPVHGLTIRQLDDYLARNPGYRAAYGEESRRREAAGPGITTPPVGSGYS